MALTPTDFADITARGLFISEMANASAVNESTLLKSGYVIDAKVAGAFANEAHSVNFPVFNASNVVAVTLPADGSVVANSYAATETFVTENCSDYIVPYQYMPSAANRGIGGEAGHLERIAGHVSKVIAATVEADLITTAEARATAASTVISTYNTGNLTRKAITTCATATWGASWRRSDSAIVVHPDVYNDVINSTDYVAASSSSLMDLSEKPIETYMGMALIQSDFAKFATETVGGNSKTVYRTILVKRGALQYYFNNLRNFDETHIPGSGSNQIDMTFSYALHASRNYLHQPIVIKTQAGVA